jgi:hypothetical protein
MFRLAIDAWHESNGAPARRQAVSTSGARMTAGRHFMTIHADITHATAT